MSNPSIEIIKVTKLKDTGCLRALVDFKLGESEFYSWRIIQQDNQDAWVSSPQESWEADGQKHYKPLIKFNKDLMALVSEAILEVYNRADIEQSEVRGNAK